MRILITQTLYLGDLVLTIPLLERVREIYPASSLHLLVRKGLEGIFRADPAVSSVITFDRDGEDKGWRGVVSLTRRVRAGRYDMALVLPGSLRTALAVYLAGIPRRIGSNQSSGLLLFEGLVQFPAELRQSPHARPVLFMEKVWRAFSPGGSVASPMFTDVVPLNVSYTAPRRYLQLLEPLGVGIQEELRVPRLHPTEQDRRMVDGLLHGRVGSLIAIAPGSLWNTKRWPTDYFRALALSFLEEEHTVILVGGETDADICHQIVGDMPQPGILNLCGRLTPLQSAEVIRRCRILISNDSAPMHLALAVSTPCVAIFGPTVPSFGFVPFPDRTIVVQVDSLPCRPCTPHGGARCPIGTHECMTVVSVDSVRSIVTECLKKQDRQR